MPNIYITGSTGFVASKTTESFPKNWNLITPEVGELDITNEQSLKNYFDGKNLDAIINFAAITDVDGAEKESGNKEGPCWKVNVEGLRNLAALAKSKNALMVQISTDMVFDGKNGPYAESAQPAAKSEDVGWYAWTKLAGEKLLKDEADDFAIVRIIFPTGNFASPKDYLAKLKGGLEKGYSMFADQICSPTYIPDLAKALVAIVEKKKTGIYHVATYPVSTPYEIAKAISEKYNLGEVKPGLLFDYLKKDGVAKRPIKGGLLCDDTQRELGLTFASWREVVATF